MSFIYLYLFIFCDGLRMKAIEYLTIIHLLTEILCCAKFYSKFFEYKQRILPALYNCSSSGDKTRNILKQKFQNAKISPLPMNGWSVIEWDSGNNYPEL